MTDAPEIIRRWEQLAAERVVFESTWQDVADYELGRRDFLTKRTQGERRDTKLFDTTAMQSADFLASSLHGFMTNPSTRWFELRIDDDYLEKSEPVQLWLEDAADRMFAVFADPDGMHAQACHEFYLDLGSFGTAGMFIGDAPGKGVIYQTRALGELYVAENAAGRIDMVFRKFSLSARQAKQEFGDRAPPKVEQALANNKPHEMFEFVHAVYPRHEYDGQKQDSGNMPFESCYVSLADKTKVSEGGFRELPYMIARWSKDAGETYGRGPGWSALAEQMMLHAMSKTMLKAAQKRADPPLLVADDGVMLPVRTVPGGLNFGRMDANRQEFIRALKTEGDVGLTLEIMEQRRQAVRDAFYTGILQMLRDPRMTAEQVRALQDEMMRLMGPTLGRLQSEFLGPMIDRTFAIMARQMLFDDPPEELAGREIRVEYVSPLAKMQKAGQANAVVKTLQVAGEMAAFAPETLDNIDPDQAIRIISEANGAPMKVLRDPRVVQAMRRAKQEEARRQATLAATEQMAGAVGKVAPMVKNMMPQEGAA